MDEVLVISRGLGIYHNCDHACVAYYCRMIARREQCLRVGACWGFVRGICRCRCWVCIGLPFGFADIKNEGGVQRMIIQEVRSKTNQNPKERSRRHLT
jgi:hypothetical protein